MSATAIPQSGKQEVAKLPELKTYMEKQLLVRLQGKRKVKGVLRGFDAFMNIVLHDAVEERFDGTCTNLGITMIRGNTIVNLELMQAE